jgi:hypothetical protein
MSKRPLQWLRLALLLDFIAMKPAKATGDACNKRADQK